MFLDNSFTNFSVTPLSLKRSHLRFRPRREQMKRFPRFEICSHRQFRRQPAFVPSLCTVNYIKLTLKKKKFVILRICQNEKDFYYALFYDAITCNLEYSHTLHRLRNNREMREDSYDLVELYFTSVTTSVNNRFLKYKYQSSWLFTSISCFTSIFVPRQIGFCSCLKDSS